MGKIIALYGGGFKPPTLGHFEVVKRALAENPEIDEFIIYVGAKERNGITQAQSIIIWEIYQTYLPMKVRIEPSKSPIGDIMRFAKENTEDTIYFVIGSRKGNEGDEQDYQKRTKNVEIKYPNTKIKLITTPLTGVSGTKTRDSFKSSPKEFYKYLPKELTDKEKEEVYDTIKTPTQDNLNENASYSQDIDVKSKIMELTQHMLDKGYNIEPLPKVEFVDGDSSNAREFLGKTAYYNPENQTIVLYTEGRHPKDIVRSFSHEMIHHIQNLEGRLGNITTTNTHENDELNKIEAEANLKGTMTFRNWTDSLNEGLGDVSLDYIKTKLPKLDSYPKSDIILSKGDFTYINIPQDKDFGMTAEIKVFDQKDGTLVAQSSFDYDKNGKLKGTLDVRPDKRRLGIATEIYKLAEKIIGDTIFPEEKHTEDAEKFWQQKNRSFGPKTDDSLNEGINEYNNSGPTTPKVYIVKDDGTYKEAPIELLSKISNLTYDMGGGETNYYPEKNIVIVDNIPVEEFAKEPGDIKDEKVYVEYNLNKSISLPKASKIIASQLVYHLDDIKSFAQTVSNSLKSGGTFEFFSDMMFDVDKDFLKHLSKKYGFGLPENIDSFKGESLPLKKGEYTGPTPSPKEFEEPKKEKKVGKVVNDEDGTVEYYNEKSQLHREDGPAVVGSDLEEWYINGKLHRENKPAYIDKIYGWEIWYKNGKPHRENGPAVVGFKGSGLDNSNKKAWWLNGKEHSEEEFNKISNKLEEKSKDPFGLNQYARELAQGLEEAIVGDRIKEAKEEVTDSMVVVLSRNDNQVNLYNLKTNEALGNINTYGNEVTGVAAKKGYGPLMYELGMANIYPNGLQSDRRGNTEAPAETIWKKYIAGASPNIKVEKLTPKDKDYRTTYAGDGYDSSYIPDFYNYKFYNPNTTTLKQLIQKGNTLSDELRKKIILDNDKLYNDLVNEAIVGDKIECDNCGWSWDIEDGGDDLFTCHKCWHDNTPQSNLDIPKFNYEKTLSENLWNTLNEITLSKENAVGVSGDLTGGKFTVGNVSYDYSIKNIPNPYKDLGSFYNIQFTPTEEMTSIPQMGKENYIKILSTMYKIIVDFVEKEKPDYIGIASLDNSGKNYHKVYANLTNNKSNNIPGYFRKDVSLEFNSPGGNGRFVVLKQK